MPSIGSENQSIPFDNSLGSLENPDIDEYDKICIPMILQSIVQFIDSDIIMPSTRSHLIHKISLSLITYENLDAILSIQGWQKIFLKFIVDEQKRFLSFQEKVNQITAVSAAVGKSPELELWEHRYRHHYHHHINSSHYDYLIIIIIILLLDVKRLEDLLKLLLK